MYKLLRSTAYLKNRRNKFTDSEIQELLKQAQTPFVYMHFDHGRNDTVYPTAQAACRPIQPIGNAERKEILKQQIEFFKRMYNDIDIIESTSNGLISGCPANIIKASFTTTNQEGCEFQVLNRTYTIINGY